jgi:hypothetical protein
MAPNYFRPERLTINQVAILLLVAFLVINTKIEATRKKVTPAQPSLHWLLQTQLRALSHRLHRV